MSDPEQPSESNSLTPEQRLEPANADILRASIETIHESYSDIQAAETAKRVDDLLRE